MTENTPKDYVDTARKDQFVEQYLSEAKGSMRVAALTTLISLAVAAVLFAFIGWLVVE